MANQNPNQRTYLQAFAVVLAIFVGAVANRVRGNAGWGGFAIALLFVVIGYLIKMGPIPYWAPNPIVPATYSPLVLGLAYYAFRWFGWGPGWEAWEEEGRDEPPTEWFQLALYGTIWWAFPYTVLALSGDVNVIVAAIAAIVTGIGFPIAFTLAYAAPITAGEYVNDPIEREELYWGAWQGAVFALSLIATYYLQTITDSLLLL